MAGDHEEDGQRAEGDRRVEPPPATRSRLRLAGGQGLELADRPGVPAGREPVGEAVGQPAGELDVGQRVTTEADEGVRLGGVGPAEGAGEVGQHRAVRGARLRWTVELGQGEERGVVGLAGAGERHPGDDVDPDGMPRDPAAARHRVPGAGGRAPGREEEVDGSIGGDHTRVLPDVGAQLGLEGVEVEAQAEDLAVAVASADDLEQAVDLTGQVAGAQLVDLAPTGQVGRTLGIAQHHVRAGVDELAHAGALVDGLVEGQLAPGDGDPDGAGVLVGEGGWQPRHPGGGLGLAVHHDEVPATGATDARPASYGLGRESAPGLRDVTQRGQLALLEPAGSEELEGVGNAGEARRPGGGEQVARSTRRRRSAR